MCFTELLEREEDDDEDGDGFGVPPAISVTAPPQTADRPLHAIDEDEEQTAHSESTADNYAVAGGATSSNSNQHPVNSAPNTERGRPEDHDGNDGPRGLTQEELSILSNLTSL